MKHINDALGGRITPPSVYACVLARRGYSSSGLISLQTLNKSKRGHKMTHVKNLPGLLEEKRCFKLNMFLGIDGFVDEILHVVDKRQDVDTFTRINTMKEFGERIIKAAGLSTNIEMVTAKTKLGGNGPILANALIEYGVSVTYAGALGAPDLHPIFAPMAKKSVKTYNLINPGLSDAVEFDDGKIIFGKHTPLKELTWEKFKSSFGGAKELAAILEKQDLLAMVNWTMMAYMSEIWEGMINEVFPLLQTTNKPIAFFDLADPEKRTKEDIKHAMKLIGGFETKFSAILGLNEKELYEIAAVLDIEKKPTLSETSLEVYKKLGIHCLVVHPVSSALCIVDGEVFETDGPYCKKPVLTTGAGDNFNSGFVLGQALGMDPLSCLTLGVVTSGFYVRNAKSPTYDDAIKFAKDWEAGKVD